MVRSASSPHSVLFGEFLQTAQRIEGLFELLLLINEGEVVAEVVLGDLPGGCVVGSDDFHPAVRVSLGEGGMWLPMIPLPKGDEEGHLFSSHWAMRVSAMKRMKGARM